MKKTVLLLALLFFAIGSTAGAVETFGSFGEVKARAAKLDKPLLVEFYAVW